MRNLNILLKALDYIEANLTQPFAQEEVAAACCFSLSGVQKIFRYALHMSLKEYITKRRMTSAARALTQGASVIDVAMQHQYNSPEVFTRAFTKVWGMPPSVFKGERRFTGLFPKIIYHLEGVHMKRQVDISELYETIKGRMGKYVLYFDIKGLMPINAVSRLLGDAAIRESLTRIEAAATEGMLLFRIGGDEFALLTDTDSREAVTAVAERIVAHNGSPVEADGASAPLHLWAGGMRLAADAMGKEDEVFQALQEKIEGMKSKGQSVFILD